ncbi:MAG: ABC transporter substrate-binding protein [Acidobacteriota bacterium]|nr:ABC transporter substrate-binding protein [Acidobacteriota bacterium]
MSSLLLGLLCVAAIVVSAAPPTVRPPAREAAVFPAHRAVVLPVILSAYTTINGGSQNLLAVSNVAREWGSYGLLGKVYPGTERLPVVGRMIIPEPEQLLKVHPDALFVHKQQAEVLRKIGMPGLVEVNFMPRDARKSRQSLWQLVGRATMQGPRVMQLLNWDAAQRRQLAGQLGGIPAAHRPRVLLVHAGRGMWSVPGGYYAMGSSIEEAGGTNLAANFRLNGQINLEQIIALDPDILLLDPNVMMSPYASSHDVSPRDIYNMPECSVLRAVKERRVYELPQHSYTNDAIEDPLLLAWMAEIFHPELPRQLRGVYRAAYQQIYGFALSEDDIDRAIFFNENLPSAGYERFRRGAEQ